MAKGQDEIAEANKSWDKLCCLLENASKPTIAETGETSQHHSEASLVGEEQVPSTTPLAPKVSIASDLPSLSFEGVGTTDVVMVKAPKEGSTTNGGPEKSATGEEKETTTTTTTTDFIKPNLEATAPPEGIPSVIEEVSAETPIA